MTVANETIGKFDKESTIDEVSRLFRNNHMVEIVTTCTHCGGILIAKRDDNGNINCKCDTCGVLIYISKDYR